MTEISNSKVESIATKLTKKRVKVWMKKEDLSGIPEGELKNKLLKTEEFIQKFTKLRKKLESYLIQDIAQKTLGREMSFIKMNGEKDIDKILDKIEGNLEEISDNAANRILFHTIL